MPSPSWQVGASGEVVPVFVEVDLATMTQPGSGPSCAATSLTRRTRRGNGRHSACLVLLLLTTSPARATGFLAVVDKLRPRQRMYAVGDEDEGRSGCRCRGLRSRCFRGGAG